MKLEYDDLKGRRITAEWVAHPLGHLVFRHAATGHKIRNARQPIASKEGAEGILRGIALDPGAKAVWLEEPPENALTALLEPQEAQS